MGSQRDHQRLLHVNHPYGVRVYRKYVNLTADSRYHRARETDLVLIRSHPHGATSLVNCLSHQVTLFVLMTRLSYWTINQRLKFKPRMCSEYSCRGLEIVYKGWITFNRGYLLRRGTFGIRVRKHILVKMKSWCRWNQIVRHDAPALLLLARLRNRLLYFRFFTLCCCQAHAIPNLCTEGTA